MEQYTDQSLDNYDERAVQDVLAEGRKDPRYRQLLARIGGEARNRDLGMFAVRISVGAICASAPFLTITLTKSLGALVASSLVAGFGIVQLVFVGHEFDHGAGPRSRKLASVFSKLFMTVLCGYGLTYFHRDHWLHHAYTQNQDLDPDTHSSLLALTPKGAAEKRGLGRLVSRFQSYAIPLLFFVWALDSKMQSMRFALRNFRVCKQELILFAVHFVFWFGVGGLCFGWLRAVINYVVWVIAAGLYLGIAIPINHVGTTVFERDTTSSFLERQISGSRDVVGPRIFDFLLLGLNLQIEHHLFPWIPSTRLRYVREAVVGFCAENGLPYRESSYREALRDVWTHFGRMANIVAGSGDSPLRS